MRDEIVTFMLDTSPVTSQTLKMVCDHIEFSSNATTCFIEKVPLSFVFGKEATSLNNFLQVIILFLFCNKENILQFTIHIYILGF